MRTISTFRSHLLHFCLVAVHCKNFKINFSFTKFISWFYISLFLLTFLVNLCNLSSVWKYFMWIVLFFFFWGHFTHDAFVKTEKLEKVFCRIAFIRIYQILSLLPDSKNNDKVINSKIVFRNFLINSSSVWKYERDIYGENKVCLSDLK